MLDGQVRLVVKRPSEQPIRGYMRELATSSELIICNVRMLLGRQLLRHSDGLNRESNAQYLLRLWGLSHKIPNIISI